MRLSLLLIIVSQAALVCQQTLGQDPHSVVDYLRSTGRATDFESRRQMFQQVVGDQDYIGNAGQNQRLHGILKVGDMFQDSQIQSLGMLPASMVTMPAVSVNPLPLMTLQEIPTVTDLQLKNFCAPKLGPETFDTKILTLIGYSDDSCCGSTRQCEHLPRLCFQSPLMMRNQQEIACWKHDQDLARSAKSWFELSDTGVRNIHRQLASESSDPMISTAFRVLTLFGFPSDDVPRAEDLQQTGLPLYLNGRRLENMIPEGI
jgi:hypothetical protein